MGKTDSWIQYFLQVAQMFLVILISVDCGLVWLLKDPKTHVRTNRLDCRILSRAQLEGLEVQALEPEFLMKIPSNGGGKFTKALKDTADFVNSLVKHPELCTVTSILHSLQATEIKHIIKFVLRSFSELYRFKQLIETSQMDRLIESYETLTNVNYDMEDWFKEHNNFNYINNIQQVPESYLYNLFTFHTLETHVKFNPEKLSKLVMNEIVTYRKNFNNIQSFQGRYIQKVYKTMESMLNFAE
ncbi:hypothetical protein BY996DRAFT_6418110 [Phakopsora pachyrhizi]|nr:hypothetical protein BY996DRAFT_6418110 [Phakopsora pachyrhizi]